MTTASATRSLWVSATSTRLIPTCRARSRRRSPQEERRATGLAAHHLDVVPTDGADAHAEGLQRGLLGREPRRIALDGILAQLGVGPLPRREEAIDDRGLPRQHGPEAFEVDDVDPTPRITTPSPDHRLAGDGAR